MSEHEEPPPSYTAHTEDSQSTASSSSSSSRRPPRRHATVPPSGSQAFDNATNYHYVSMTHGCIEDKWVIDPMRRVPASLLPPLRYGESATTRSNLRLETLNGNISADVTLVQSPRRDSDRKKTILFAKTHHGNIGFRLVSTGNPTFYNTKAFSDRTIRHLIYAGCQLT
jgi:hypothetical protein